MGISSQNFYPDDVSRAKDDNWVHLLNVLPPKMCHGEKTSKIRRDFWQLSSLIANISGKDPQIENRKSNWSTKTHPTLGEKKLVNFGPQTKKLLTWILTKREHIFRETSISARKGVLRPQIFTRAIEWPVLARAHSNGDGCPRKI